MQTQTLFSTADTSIIDVQRQGAITIAQLCHEPSNSLEYISIHNAFRTNSVKVEEVSESGNVNELFLTNLSNKYLFIMDGDILKGAKQNRVVNTSILVGPNKKMFIPVSCVEQGRWNYRSDKFRPSDEVAHGKIRREKSMNIYFNEGSGKEKYQANQSQVWGNVEESMGQLGVFSSTASHSDTFREKQKDFTKLISKITLNKNANGLAYFVNGTLSGIEIFNRNDVYADYFEKLKYAIAMDAEIKLLTRVESESISDDKVIEDILYCIDDFNNQLDKIDSCEGAGLGVESRLVTDKEVYYDLTYQKQTVHQSILIFDGPDRFRNLVRQRNQRFRTVEDNIKINKELIDDPVAEQDEDEKVSFYTKILKYFRSSNE